MITSLRTFFALSFLVLLMGGMLPLVGFAASNDCTVSYDGGKSGYEGKWQESDAQKACRPFNDAVVVAKRQQDRPADLYSYAYKCTGSSDIWITLGDDHGDSFDVHDWNEGKHWTCSKQLAGANENIVPVLKNPTQKRITKMLVRDAEVVYSEGLVPGFESYSR